MKIKSYLHDYHIEYPSGFSFLQELQNINDKLVIIDRKVYGLYKNVFDRHFDSSSLMLIDALEETKTIESAITICEKATGINAKRNLKLIAIGGGIIQDIVGFAAHILYRGVGLILVPTTLLAQGDSCVGSKNSLNYLNFKNILGTIYPPEKVYVCTDFLKTLSDLDFHSGLGEVVRFRIMDDLCNIDVIEKEMDKLINRDSRVVRDLIEKAHAYKKRMVELDEFDLKQRKIFNYGHTFGHAFEAVSNYQIPHGLAVVLGIIAANRISMARGILEKETVYAFEHICMCLYNAGPLSCNDFDAFVEIMKKDKKREGDGIPAVLLSSGGFFAVFQDVSAKEVVSAIQYVQDLVNGVEK